MEIYKFEFDFDDKRYKAKSWKIPAQQPNQTVQFHCYDFEPGYEPVKGTIMFIADANKKVHTFSSHPDTFAFTGAVYKALADYCNANGIDMF
jgi:hypothetical protein